MAAATVNKQRTVLNLAEKLEIKEFLIEQDKSPGVKFGLNSKDVYRQVGKAHK